MKKLGLLVALSCVGVFGQNSTHDAPLEVESRSVHVYFRADTLIDPAKVSPPYTQSRQLLQHTHRRDHKVRIFVGGRAPSDVMIKQNDELHFRLAGKRRFFGIFPGAFRGYLTVKSEERPGVGGLVAGHVAKLHEKNKDCDRLQGTEFTNCVAKI